MNLPSIRTSECYMHTKSSAVASAEPKGAVTEGNMASLVRVRVIVCLLLSGAAFSYGDGEAGDPTGDLLKKLFKVLSRDGKIMRGENAALGDFPSIARLSVTLNGKVKVCGGSLVASQWVLTAAHCLQDNGQASHVEVHLGDVDSAVQDPGEQTQKSAGIYIHPEYRVDEKGLLLNDIALVKLSTAVQPSNTVRVASLPPQDSDVEIETKCQAAGWGSDGTQSSDASSRLLKYVDLWTYPMEDCEWEIQVKGFHIHKGNPSTTLCAADLDNPSRQHCKGDSGGPLVCGGVLRGLVSYQYNRCSTGPALPGFFTRVSHYTQWIRSTMAAKRSLNDSALLKRLIQLLDLFGREETRSNPDP